MSANYQIDVLDVSSYLYIHFETRMSQRYENVHPVVFQSFRLGRDRWDFWQKFYFARLCYKLETNENKTYTILQLICKIIQICGPFRYVPFRHVQIMFSGFSGKLRWLSVIITAVQLQQWSLYVSAVLKLETSMCVKHEYFIAILYYYSNYD